MKPGLALVFAGLALSGCAGAPAFTRADYVETKDILRAIEAELCAAVEWVETTPDVRAGVLAAGLDIRNFVASATVGLAVAVQTDASGQAGLVVPVSLGTTGVSASLGTEVLRTRETTLTVYFPFAELECDAPPVAGAHRIAGSLGLADWIKETTKILFSINEAPVSYSYGVGFTLTNSAGAGPTFSIVPGTSNLGGGASLGVTRELTHSLSVTVVEIRPDSELAARYRIPDETRRRLDRAADIEAIRDAVR